MELHEDLREANDPLFTNDFELDEARARIQLAFALFLIGVTGLAVFLTTWILNLEGRMG